jgi:hypothetical protein
MEVSGEVYATVALTPGKEPQYPLNGKINGTQRRYGHVGEKKNILSPLGFQTLVVHTMG